MNQRLDRIRKEVVALALNYGPANYDDQEGRWVRLAHLPLPTGWNRDATSLLIELPTAYPEVPPSGCFIDKGLNCSSHYYPGSQHNRYSELGWAWFCLHFDQGWKPSADVWSGDNLLTIVETIRTALSEIIRAGP